MQKALSLCSGPFLCCQQSAEDVELFVSMTSADLVDRFACYPVSKRKHSTGFRTGSDRSSVVSVDLSLIGDAHADDGCGGSGRAFVLVIDRLAYHVADFDTGRVAARHVDGVAPGVDLVPTMTFQQPVSHGTEPFAPQSMHGAVVEVVRP